MISKYLQRENMDGDCGNEGLEPSYLPIQMMIQHCNIGPSLYVQLPF